MIGAPNLRWFPSSRECESIQNPGESAVSGLELCILNVFTMPELNGHIESTQNVCLVPAHCTASRGQCAEITEYLNVGTQRVSYCILTQRVGTRKLMSSRIRCFQCRRCHMPLSPCPTKPKMLRFETDSQPTPSCQGHYSEHNCYGQKVAPSLE